MQLGWWHVLWPDHLPRTPTLPRPCCRTPSPPDQRVSAPPAPPRLSSPQPQFPSPSRGYWTGQRRRPSGFPMLRVDSSGVLKGLRSTAVTNGGFYDCYKMIKEFLFLHVSRPCPAARIL